MTDQPPAITRPGEMWHLNGYNLSQVMVHRRGVNPETGDHYKNASGQINHTISVADFKTVRDAAAAVQARNAWEDVCEAHNMLVKTGAPEGLFNEAFTRCVQVVLAKYGRTRG
jgi:hypothetical protein